jgi:hypothetical protein
MEIAVIDYELTRMTINNLPDENACREDCEADTGRGKHEGDKRPRRKPIDNFGRNFIASRDVHVRSIAVAARLACVVEGKGVDVALDANPTTLILEITDRTGGTRFTAYRFRFSALPLHRLEVEVKAVL